METVTDSKLTVTTQECSGFPGGWSVNSEQMFTALNATTYRDILRILEFGSGTGTNVLANILSKKSGMRFSYTTYENNINYVCKAPAVTTVMWERLPEKLVDGIFDLIIIDGPKGVDRSKWYPLIRPNIRRGTILLIDDYSHFKEFGEALNANFTYEDIEQVDMPYTPPGPFVTWRTVRLLTAIVQK